MANTRGKVIETVRRRHQLEADLFGMLDLSTDDELDERAGRIAGAGRDAIPIILRHLGAEDQRMIGALGNICRRFDDAGEIGLALRGVAGSRGRPDCERIAAILILDRYLEEELEDELFDGLDNEDLAVRSITAMLDEARQSRLVLLDYVTAIDDQPVEAAQHLLGALQRAPGEQMVEPLRLLAQDSRPEVAQAAIRALGTIRLPDAGRALQILINGCDASVSACAKRALRKLSLAGVQVAPLPQVDPNWRCLVSPIDGDGRQSVWFIHTVPSEPTCCFLHVLLNDHGLVESLGDDQAMARHFPPPRRRGSVHVFSLADEPCEAIVLETDFDYGRSLVRRALARRGGTRSPLPPAYRLFSDFLWTYDASNLDAGPKLPAVDDRAAEELVPYTGGLLDHVGFAAWFAHDRAVYRQAMWLLGDSATNKKRHSAAFLKELLACCFDARSRARCARGLLTMGEWLMWLGDEWAAELALAAARTVEADGWQCHPFLVRLVENGVARARADLRK